MNKFHLVVILACAAGLNAGLIFESNGCPEFHSKQDFVAAPYVGVWYEMKKFPNPFERGQTCARAIYSVISDNVIGVHNTGVLADGTLNDINGTATAAFPDEPGHLLLQFPGVPDGDYWVLDTDYTSYTSIYSCGTIAGIKIEYAWLMTRQNTISPELYKTAAAAYTKYGINVNKFIDQKQGDGCVYYP